MPDCSAFGSSITYCGVKDGNCPVVGKWTLGRASSFLRLAPQEVRVKRKEGGGGRRTMDPSNKVVSTDLALDRVAENLHIQKAIHLA